MNGTVASIVGQDKPRKVLRDSIRLLGRRYVEPTLAAFVCEMVAVLYDPRDLTEVHVYHEGRFVCRALSPEHLAAPALRDNQRARREAQATRHGHAHHHGGCR
ncbi:Mu transposase C-terminal domain-containing protein [Loktanella sp. M215]|uniref:Mu transposase C-terminal domain-containing protein n=1 Tax=Loktanella sp. M215 TaxID=2675431 RepID=UPI001F3C3559|nr:Mu transposase C-terminal domain-containing protein [Loktanella sp. M215]